MPPSRSSGKPRRAKNPIPPTETLPVADPHTPKRRTAKSPRHDPPQSPHAGGASAGPAAEPEVGPADEIGPALRGDASPAVSYSNAAIAGRARNAALSVVGVTSVGSRATAVTTYGLPGESVRGVLVQRFSGGMRVEVHVTARPVPLVALGASVRRAVEQELSTLGLRGRIDICIDDLDIDDLDIDDLDDAP